MGARAVYKALLRCYPAAFRDEYGNQMLLMFSEQLGEARRTGLREQAALWAHAASDAFTIAPQEHCHVIFHDIRYAFRAMRANPGFTAVAVLSLALGIGANTAIFSLWNGMLHSTMPGVAHPEQIVMLTDPDNAGMWHGNSQGERPWLTWPEFEQIRGQASSFSDIMACQSSLQDWRIRFEGRDWEDARGRLVSGNYFSFLGVTPLLGRIFTTEDDRRDAPYAVISHSYWQRRFGGSPDVLGRTFTVQNTALTVIGVTPPGFSGETIGQQPDLWVPIHMQPLVVPGEDWLHETPPQKVVWLHVFGRLKPGVTLARANAEANGIFRAGLESFYPGTAPPERRREWMNQWLRVRSGAAGASETRGDFSTSIVALMAAVGLLLLIACANLANLLLARGAARKAEMALRLSLGASRGRVIRQLVTESMVLASIGAAGGLLAAWFVHGALVGMITRSDPSFHMSFSLDPVVLAFTLGVTLAAALLFGLLPAWQMTRADAASGLREHSRGAGGSLGRMRLGRSLVSLQLALSLPLLVGAGLLVRTVYNLQHLNFGFRADRLLLVSINSRVAGYNSARSHVLFQELGAQVRRIPGVQAVSYSHNGLFTGGNSGDEVQVEGYTRKGEDDRGSSWEMIGPDYFATLGIPVLLGREIRESDHSGGPMVTVINETFAKTFFAGRNPIGFHVSVIDETPEGNRARTYQVVEVAADTRTGSLRAKIEPKLYLPFTQPPGDSVKRATYLIRSGCRPDTTRGSRPAGIPASGRELADWRGPHVRRADSTIYRAQSHHRSSGGRLRLRRACASSDRPLRRSLLRDRAA